MSTIVAFLQLRFIPRNLAGYVVLLVAGGGVFSLDAAAYEPPLKTT